MIVAAPTECCVATARGPIVASHVMVLLVKHAPRYAACPPELRAAIQHMKPSSAHGADRLGPADVGRLPDDALAELMRSGPRYLVGPNGELIIAGGDHVLTGYRER